MNTRAYENLSYQELAISGFPRQGFSLPWEYDKLCFPRQGFSIIISLYTYFHAMHFWKQDYMKKWLLYLPYLFLLGSGLLLIIQYFLFCPFQTAETEVFRNELAVVRTELEPWEKQIIECRGKHEVASAEKDLLNKKVRLVVQGGHWNVWSFFLYSCFIIVSIWKFHLGIFVV